MHMKNFEIKFMYSLRTEMYKVKNVSLISILD